MTGPQKNQRADGEGDKKIDSNPFAKDALVIGNMTIKMHLEPVAKWTEVLEWSKARFGLSRIQCRHIFHDAVLCFAHINL